jgi:hypothetical protein
MQKFILVECLEEKNIFNESNLNSFKSIAVLIHKGFALLFMKNKIKLNEKQKKILICHLEKK